VHAAEKFCPDVILTVDGKGFNFRLLKKLRRLGAKHVHVVAPSRWAVKSFPEAVGLRKRPGTMDVSAIVDSMCVILPFEPSWYSHEVKFVGFPALEEVFDFGVRLQARDVSQEETCLLPNEWWEKVRNTSNLSKVGFENKKSPSQRNLIGVFPGSRVQELESVLPRLKEMMSMASSQTRFLVSSTDITRPVLVDALKSVGGEILNSKEEIMDRCEVALATSGTIVMELAFRRIPTVVIYDSDPITRSVATFLSRGRFASIPNLILGREAIPELLFNRCTPSNMLYALQNVEFEAEIPEVFPHLLAIDSSTMRAIPPSHIIAKELF